jgi:hypothetical protein
MRQGHPSVMSPESPSEVDLNQHLLYIQRLWRQLRATPVKEFRAIKALEKCIRQEANAFRAAVSALNSKPKA